MGVIQMDTENSMVAYVDVDDALKRIGGNMGLYKRLLSRFIEVDQFVPLKEALQSGDTEEAARLAHTLKGVSANLSLAKVKNLSTELEQLVKSGSDHTAKLAELGRAYNETVQMITEILV